jgi:hypothetical protein
MTNSAADQGCFSFKGAQIPIAAASFSQTYAPLFVFP